MRSIIIVMLICVSFGVFGMNQIDIDSGDPATLKLRESLIGTWHIRFDQRDGGYREEYLTVSKNGTFRLLLLSTNRLERLVDAYAIVGIWGVAEDIFFTTNLRYEYQNDVEYPAYLGDAHEFNAYRILEINETFQRYQSLGEDTSVKLDKIVSDPCEKLSGIKIACSNHDRILEPSGSNSGAEISLAE